MPTNCKRYSHETLSQHSFRNPASFICLFARGLPVQRAPVSFYLSGLWAKSDILDGYIARKTNSQTKFGAQLDSFADLVFFGSIAVLFIMWAGNEQRLLLLLMLAILIIRGINLLIAGIKFRCLAMLHTWTNKFAGLLVFTAPIAFAFGCTTFLLIICVAALTAALEESIIHLTSDHLDLNRRSRFSKN